ncbi:NAD(P)/FAD-dependent oxidoreductase [Aquibacillus salsiterrae]|uniref:NAD(P)/FAD-dependent oxidoreductase n=1 Tax=Aquibacillus salsiterrae TaxID=2950439 RepID=A0A9X3WER0_9BACI|nr:NAD(P)/FAD-dependent oxidoreductase [Aquibacillus salsiterrae]MDC3416895.1 NAD(P)/FAD-dependent oxidoreductase [Aquibacillus salsiterrae]
MIYDCAIVGGGIAGLQAAIQLGRYNHDVIVIDAKSNGRSNLCQCYHNMLGWKEGVSGQNLRDIGTDQAKSLGVAFHDASVKTVEKEANQFRISDDNGNIYQAKRLLFSTGVKDNIPHFPKLYPCLGKSVYICPDCDGHEIKGKKTIVMGSGKAGVGMALTLTYFSNDLLYVNHGEEKLEPNHQAKLKQHNISYYEANIKDILADQGQFHGVILDDGSQLHANHSFIAFGGNEVKSELAASLGVELHRNKHILVNPRTQMTSVENVWAAGDVVAHSEQVTIAMGDGMQAAIWIHKTLMSTSD